MLGISYRKSAIARFLSPGSYGNVFFCSVLRETKRTATLGNVRKYKENLLGSFQTEFNGIFTTEKSSPSGEKLPSSVSRMWVTAVSNKMLQPHHVSPQSKKLVNWKCLHCDACFSRRVDLHVGLGGQCPHCQHFPSPKRIESATQDSMRSNASLKSSSRRGILRVSHTMTPSKKSSIVAQTKVVEEKNKMKKNRKIQNEFSSSVSIQGIQEGMLPRRAPRSMSDGHYLRREERRILLPMLAKNFEKEREKILPNEILYVSPKLDGIRCVVSFSKRSNRLLFFSRAGTMFECCDQFIEPALIPLFQKDPNLVLDGELYNDFSNQARIQQILSKNKYSVLQHWRQPSAVPPSRKGKKKAGFSLGTEEPMPGEENAIVFDDLVSAVRTTRAKRTCEVAGLQAKLQYHVFDVLYSSSLCPGQSPFSDRWQLLHEAYHQNILGGSMIDKYASLSFPLSLSPLMEKNPWEVIRLVPCVQCTIANVDSILQDTISAGYEGVMVRRNGLLTSTSAEGSQLDVSGGYRYGQRSGTLLKYKRMKDDEFVIVDAVEGKGKWKGCLGAFICLAHDSKKLTFSVSPAISEDQKRLLWSRNQAADLIGKVLTVQFQELTSDGIPRFPVGKTVRGSESKIDWI